MEGHWSVIRAPMIHLLLARDVLQLGLVSSSAFPSPIFHHPQYLQRAKDKVELVALSRIRTLERENVFFFWYRIAPTACPNSWKPSLSSHHHRLFGYKSRGKRKTKKKGPVGVCSKARATLSIGGGSLFRHPDCQLPAKKLRETHELFALFLRQYCLSLSLFCQAKQWAGLRIVFRTSRPFRLLSLASFILGRSGLTLCTATPGTLYRSMNTTLC